MSPRSRSFAAVTRAVLRALVVALLATVAAPPAAQAAPPPPNKSFIVFTPGKAVIGTLSGGAWTPKRTLTGKAWKGWTHIAVSRTTLLLYNATTGQARTGTFQNGKYSPVAARTVFAGADIVTASCNTVMFYDRETGFAQTYTLGQGRLGNTATNAALPRFLQTGAASCDTVMLRPSSTAKYDSGVTGLLTSGRFTPRGWVGPGLNVAATATSYVLLGRYSDDRFGAWGTAVAGSADATGTASDFGTWTHLAGTADSLLFYNSHSGGAAQWVLRNGTRTIPTQTANLGPGWTILAGGK